MFRLQIEDHSGQNYATEQNEAEETRDRNDRRTFFNLKRLSIERDREPRLRFPLCPHYPIVIGQREFYSVHARVHST